MNQGLHPTPPTWQKKTSACREPTGLQDEKKRRETPLNNKLQNLNVIVFQELLWKEHFLLREYIAQQARINSGLRWTELDFVF